MARAPLQFDFEGERVEALEGDTVAAALLRAGVRTFSRGPKYHRPRGPFCLSGHCAQCHMRVDGEPNVATCETPVHNGMRVQRQNALGSADADLLRAVDFLFPSKLDHHHLMTGHALLTATTQQITRRLAGIGEAPTDHRPTTASTRLAFDVLVIGGGPEGLAAARSQTGRVLLLEQRATLGGRRLLGEVVDTALPPHVEVRCATRAMGLYEEGGEQLVLARGPDGLFPVQCGRVVLATGGYERLLPFGSNDLPGVFAGRGLLELARGLDVRPGTRVVVLGSDGDALVVARGLAEAGFTVAGVVDPSGSLSREEARAQGVVVLSGARPLKALGTKLVRGLQLAESDGHEHEVSCDTIAVVAPLAPAYELGAEVGAQARYDGARGGFALVTDEAGQTTVPWVQAVGRVALQGSAAELRRHG